LPRGAVLVVGAAAVAQADVQQPVGAEGELAAVVVGLGLVLGEDVARALPGSARSAVWRLKLDDARVAPGVSCS